VFGVLAGAEQSFLHSLLSFSLAGASSSCWYSVPDFLVM
jgi:hypothetical protein